MRVVIAILMTAAGVQADATKPTFADDVLPILRQACVSCHSDDKQRGGLNLASFAATMTGGSSGAAVVPGQPDKSRLYTLSAHTEEPKMPPKADKLPAANLDLMKKWIEQGARENAGSAAVVAKPPPATTVAIMAVKGRPSGPPPMPGKLSREPIVTVRRPGTILALAASPWAPLVAIGGSKQIALYHTDTFELLGVLPFTPGQVNSLKYSRNGKMLLAAGGHAGVSGKAVLYDLAAAKAVVEVGIETDALLAADVSADQSRIAVGGPSKTLRIYSTSDGKVMKEIRKHTDWVTAVEFSPDGVLLASGDRAGGLYVWEAGNGNEFFTLKGPQAMIHDVAWRDDGNVLAISADDGNLRLYEMENGGQVKAWTAHPGGGGGVRFGHDGRIASTGRDKGVKCFDANGTLTHGFSTLPEQGLRVAVSHDGAAVIAGDAGGTVKVWNTKTQQVVATLDADPPPAAERLKRAEKAVVDAEAKLKAATDTTAAAKTAADKANTELAGFQKALDTANADNAKAQKELTEFKAETEKLAGALAANQRQETAKVLAEQALTEAAAKVQKAANEQPNHAELKAQAAKVTEIAKQASGEADVAKKATIAATAAHKAVSDKFAAAQKLAAATSAAVPVAQQKLAAEQAARKGVFEALATAQGKQAAATEELAMSRKVLEREKTQK